MLFDHVYSNANYSIQEMLFQILCKVKHCSWLNRQQLTAQ